MHARRCLVPVVVSLLPVVSGCFHFDLDLRDAVHAAFAAEFNLTGPLDEVLASTARFRMQEKRWPTTLEEIPTKISVDEHWREGIAGILEIRLRPGSGDSLYVEGRYYPYMHPLEVRAFSGEVALGPDRTEPTRILPHLSVATKPAPPLGPVPPDPRRAAEMASAASAR